MNNNILHQTKFDLIAFETKHQDQFERSQREQKFSQQYRDDPRNTYFDGEWDGKQGFEPEAYQWFATPYRRGYLNGVEQRLDEKFA